MKGTLVVDEHVFPIVDISLRDGSLIVTGETVATSSGAWDCHADGALFGEDGSFIKSGPRCGPPMIQHYSKGFVLRQTQIFTSKTRRWLAPNG